MKQLINQFDTEFKINRQLIKDLALIKNNHTYIEHTLFYDKVAKKQTSVIFYYE